METEARYVNENNRPGCGATGAVPLNCNEMRLDWSGFSVHVRVKLYKRCGAGIIAACRYAVRKCSRMSRRSFFERLRSRSLEGVEQMERFFRG